MLRYLIKLYSFIYTYRVRDWLHAKRDTLYSLWISNFFGSVGRGTHFYYPIRIHGGGQRNIHIGKRTSIQSFSILGCWEKYEDEKFVNPEIIIGDDCSIGEFCHITAIKKIVIGNGLLTGRFVYIGDNSHGGFSWEEADIPPVKRKLKTKGGIIIGNNVWIGDKVTILGGVTIGDNVIIGANTVVTHDVPSNTMVGGDVSRVIRTLS